MIDFSGKRVLVTGASKGIGEACVGLFARLGADVAVHFHRDAAGAERVAQAARRSGGRVSTMGADLRLWEEGERLVGLAEKQIGPLDVLVLNHGIWNEAPIVSITKAEYDAMMDANLRGMFSVASVGARLMVTRRSGCIVFIASTAAQRGEAGHAHYAASKGAIVSLTKSLAVELAPAGIRVNCVAPGWVRTPMTQGALDDAGTHERIVATVPLGRVGTPEEIAYPVAFLASEGASFMTGEIMNVNGGAVLAG